MGNPIHMLTATLLIALSASCGSDTPPTYRTLDDFSSLQLSTRSLVTTASLPSPPEGFSSTDVRLVAEDLVEISKLGTYHREVWHPRSQGAAIELVLSGIDREFRDWFEEAASDLSEGRPWANLVGTVFADDVEVIGKPRMTRAVWDVRAEPLQHEPGLAVELQTTTLYPVRHPDRSAVIGVTRSIALVSDQRGEYRTFSAGVDGAGAEPCAFVLRSVITPQPDAKIYRKSMAALLKQPAKFVPRTGDNGSDTAKSCQRRS